MKEDKFGISFYCDELDSINYELVVLQPALVSTCQGFSHSNDDNKPIRKFLYNLVVNILLTYRITIILIFKISIL